MEIKITSEMFEAGIEAFCQTCHPTSDVLWDDKEKVVRTIFTAMVEAEVKARPASRAAIGVLAERNRHREGELFDDARDDQYVNGELAYAAIAYANPSSVDPFNPPKVWPWNLHWWKPTTYRRNLEKAGSLIIAEIERLDRKNHQGVGMKLADMTPDDIQALNKHQNRNNRHSFICPNRGDGTHREFNGDLGALVATYRGWICPWCDYTQDWAHESMFMKTDGK